MITADDQSAGKKTLTELVMQKVLDIQLQWLKQ